MKSVVFLGPSLRLEEAYKLFPNACYKAPATQADIITAVESDQADAIGLIDGVFLQNLSVWHGEICYALSRGVAVYGSSSMGALRAAETDVFGTVGIGRVYEWYANGYLVDDDEVALVHGLAEQEFVPISEPLVNVRASLYAARERASLSAAECDVVISAGRSLYFADRTIGAIIDRARQLGLDSDGAARVEEVLTNAYVDVKADDARALLRRMAFDAKEGVKPKAPDWNFADPYVFQTMYDNDRRVRIGNLEVSLREIVSHISVHSLDYFSVRSDALNRAVLLFFATLLELDLTTDEFDVALNQFCSERDLRTDSDVETWCHTNHLNRAEFQRLIREEALCAKLGRWFMANRGLDRGTRFVLDEMRRRGTYPEWARRAAVEAACSEAYRADPEAIASVPKDPDALVTDHAAVTGVRVAGDVRLWAERAGFGDVEELREALNRAAIWRHVQGRIMRLSEQLALNGARRPTRSSQQNSAISDRSTS